jgi:hypothetical protein
VLIKKHQLLFFALVTTPLSTVADAPPHLWSQRFGDPGTQQSNCVVTDASGNVVLSGLFEGTVNFGGGVLTCTGDEDIFLAKFDPSGNHLWSQSFGDTNYQNAPSVAVDASGNIIITGYFRGTVDFGGGVLSTAEEYDYDVFLAKFDPSGNHLWSQSFGDTDWQLAFGVAVDASGNIIATGHFEGTIDFGGGVLTSTSVYDMYLAKFDSSGNHIWSHSYGRTNDQLSTDLAVDGSGNIIVAGRFRGTVDFGGGLLTSAGDWDIYFVKFGPEATHLWSRRFGDASFQQVGDLAIDLADNVVLTGSYLGAVNFGGGVLTSAGSYDIFLAKYDSGGNHLWSHRYGDAGVQQAQDVAIDASGNVVIAGHFGGTVDFGGGSLVASGSPFPDIFLASFDPDANHLWSVKFGDPDVEVASTVALDSWDNILLSGYFQSTVDFGGGPLTSAGGRDVFLTKFASTATGVVQGSGPPLELRAYPNPFNPSTTVVFHLPRSGLARLQVYNLNGRLMKTLVEAHKSTGTYTVTWDGRDKEGSAVASGVYFVSLSFDGTLRTQKIVILK